MSCSPNPSLLHRAAIVCRGTYSFVVSPDGKKADARNGNWSLEEPGWRARVQGNRDQWSAAISIPRSLFSRESLRINVVHADPGRDIEDCLSPTFDPGTDPDRVPHYRIGLLNSGRFARLVLD